MILTCPSCSARYLIAGDAIGEQGRAVRCGKCGHSWEQEPVHDSLDELSEQGSEAFLSGHQPDSSEPSVEAAVDAFLNDTIPEGVKPLPDPDEKPLTKAAKTPKAPREPGIVQKNMPLIGGVVAALAVFVILVSLAVMARSSIMSVMPFTKPAFVLLGVEEQGDAKTLVFDGVSAKIEGSALTVTGNLINLSASTMTLLPMVVEVLDASGKVISVLPAPLDKKTLDGEQSIPLSHTFEQISENAAQARLRFQNGDDKVSETEAKSEHSEGSEAPASAEGHESATTDATDADNTHAPPEAATDHPSAHE